MWKFKSWKGKDKWLFLAAVGVILCILAFPVEQMAGRGVSGSGPGAERNGLSQKESLSGGGGGAADKGAGSGGTGLPGGWTEDGLGSGQAGIWAESSSGSGQAGTWAGDGPEAGQAVSASGGLSYEEQLERRIQELLKHVDGVGKVDVMVVLKASAQKVIHTDGNTTYSLTEETDSSGNRRRSESREETRDTVQSSVGGQNTPVIEKEICPEISGIIISASGGGSPSVCAEISGAMEALFGLPPHKIKVLKRVE